MEQEISALMDGELFDDEAESLLDKLKNNSAAHADWQTYHLISDALRQPDHLHANISDALHERLQAEPTVLAPRVSSRRKVQMYALSAAASAMGLAMVAWMSLQIDTSTPPQMAAVQQSSQVRTASFQANQGLNGYLLAHQEFSPSADVQGEASFIRTVAGQ
jgi:sigma-E factor negative regulatory protein RseA